MSEYTKAKPIRLRDAGKDEKWLQELIARDPSILDLGDVELFGKERSLPGGGRIDMILASADSDQPIRYEVEIMLGSVDESHIIRTIEYWDIERNRYPEVEHRAVIIAENITNRFFNVISLLNKSIPIIAIKMHATLVDDKLMLSFIKVMDVVSREDTAREEEEAGELVDRNYWIKKKRDKSLVVIDAALSVLTGTPGLRIKYNRGHVAIGTSSTNYLWFMPRKGDYILVHVEVGPVARDEFIQQLEDKKIECGVMGKYDTTLTINPTASDINVNKALFKAIFDKAELMSRE